MGDHIAAAQVNGAAVSPHTVLKNGDTVQIITSEQARPQLGWIEFVKTGRARSRIRSYFKHVDQQEGLALGQRLFNRALRVAGYAALPAPETEQAQAIWRQLGVLYQGKSREQLLLEMAHGRLIAGELVAQIGRFLQDVGLRPDALVMSKERMVAQQVAPVVLAVGGADGAPARYAVCCRPLPGDAIAGQLVSGRGLEVHRLECPVGQRRRDKEPASAMALEWVDEPQAEFDATLLLHLRNTQGALAEAALAVARAGVNILRLEMLEEGRLEILEARMNVAVRNREHLEQLLKNLRRVRSVQRVERFMAE